MRMEYRNDIVIFGCSEDIRHCKGVINAVLAMPLEILESVQSDWWEYTFPKTEPGNARSDDLGAIQGKSQGESEKACPGSPIKLKARK
jgi:hypothetical protein